jgi:hypothetical protein
MLEGLRVVESVHVGENDQGNQKQYEETNGAVPEGDLLTEPAAV